MANLMRACLTLSLLFLCYYLQPTQAWSASCSDPFFKGCYGVVHKCPAGCPKACQVDCKFCKPICACDKPGAVCQDPRFIGGDGIMFYFHGKKDSDFCLVSDHNLHINAHFIGKERAGSPRGFTWVQALGVMFGRHKLYIGANKVASWDDSIDHLSISMDDNSVTLPAGQGSTVEFPSAGVKVSRVSITNSVGVEVEGIFKVIVRVVPITDEESRVHKYDITPDNCFAHLEVNFKFFNLSSRVHGVLGQTYAPAFKSRVKIGAAMPIMGGERKYAVTSLFSSECEVGRFEGDSSGTLRSVVEESYGSDWLSSSSSSSSNSMPLAASSLECSGSAFGGSKGIVCRR